MCPDHTLTFSTRKVRKIDVKVVSRGKVTSGGMGISSLLLGRSEGH